MKEINIIAEIGINHNGNIDIAKKLIDIAKDVGVNTVKFQKRTINKVYSEDDLNLPRKSPWGKTNREQKNGLEFGYKEYKIIDDYCKDKKIDWFASAWDLESLDFLDNFDLKFNKIASAMIVDKDFVENVANKNKHTFISTGMTNLEDIKYAVDQFNKSNTSFELMHCISLYPSPPEYINLKTINKMKKVFNCNVGYSGHENGIAISLAACSMGISSLERHITLDRSMYGSDQSASLEPRGLRELVGGIRKIEKAMGEEKLGYIFEEEKSIAKKLRAHIK